MNLQNKELGLYVHIPFCVQKCSYCDFVSFQKKDEYIEKYIEALKYEINSYINKSIKSYIIKTIYIGGGTPSYINSEYIKDIMYAIREKFYVDKNAEITLEINPRNGGWRKIKRVQGYSALIDLV